MRNSFPSPFSFLAPPDPPAVAELFVGGVFGIVSVTSAPESTLVIVISLGRGIGERFGFSIVQLRAIITKEGLSGSGGGVKKKSQDDQTVQEPV